MDNETAHRLALAPLSLSLSVAIHRHDRGRAEQTIAPHPPAPPPAMPSSPLPCSLPLPLLLLLLLLPPPAASSSTPNGTAATAHDVLPRYGLPEGLLPDAVASYSLGEDGRFAVELDRPSCYVQFGPYLVHYGRRVTGAIGKGSVRDVEGIQVRQLFLWLGVGEIKVDLPAADAVCFQVGWITERLPMEEFRRVHSCLDRATYRERIKGLFPEPLYEIEELITGDVHVSL